MQTMVEVAFEYLKARNVEKFETVFEVVEQAFHQSWEQEAGNKNVEYSTVVERKRGQLYKLFTVDARFKYERDNCWSASHR